MSETVLWGITGVSLGIAGTVGVFVLVMSAQLAKMGLRIRNEEKDRKRLVQNMQEATRIGAAYDATVAIRKFIEEEQKKNYFNKFVLPQHCEGLEIAVA